MSMQKSEDPSRIQFDKTINLGHILTFLGFIVTGAAMWTTMDKRVLVLEENRINQQILDKRQDVEMALQKESARQDMHEISSKLDRLIERTK